MKNNLQQPKPEAIKASYAAADPAGKKMLEDLYGAEIFTPDLTDKLLTFEDVIRETGADAADYQFTESKNANVIAGQNLAMWLLIVFAFNGKTNADWSNSDQSKFFPYADFSPGSGWSFDDYDSWLTYSYVGARQAFLNRDHVQIAVNRFSEIFKKAYQFNTTT